MSALIYWLAEKVIKKVLQWFANALGALTSWLVQWWFWAVGILLAAFWNAAPGILMDAYRVIRAGLLWITREMWHLWGKPAVEGFIAALPEEAQPSIASIQVYLNYANQWVPLDLGVSLFQVWMLFHMAWASWFLIKRHIPAMGK